MEWYTKSNREKIIEAKILDRILKEVFNGNKSIYMSKSEVWKGIKSNYFEFENNLNTLIGDGMLIEDTSHMGFLPIISMSPKGFGIASKIEKRGYEYMLGEQINKDFKNEIILYVTIACLIIGLIALFM